MNCLEHLPLFRCIALMDSLIRIDAKGMRCPRPIIELAKARRQAKHGATIEIDADDLAFESDVRAWCDTTGNILESFESDGKTHHAKILIA